MEFINNLDKHKYDDEFIRRRRLRSNEKLLSSSSSSSEAEDETELLELLSQSKNRLENTDALRIRRHLLRPEDYVRTDNVLNLYDNNNSIDNDCDAATVKNSDDESNLKIDDNDKNNNRRTLAAECSLKDLIFCFLIICNIKTMLSSIFEDL